MYSRRVPAHFILFFSSRSPVRVIPPAPSTLRSLSYHWRSLYHYWLSPVYDVCRRLGTDPRRSQVPYSALVADMVVSVDKQNVMVRYLRRERLNVSSHRMWVAETRDGLFWILTQTLTPYVKSSPSGGNTVYRCKIERYVHPTDVPEYARRARPRKERRESRSQSTKRKS